MLAGLFFVGGSADPYSAQVLVTPTPDDRLAKPTLPPSPSQADHGAEVYWLTCLPCHGEKGQGLTDEFRTTYPPEDQYCWERGCHGKNPYEAGFTLPTEIPALIGQSALAKFSDAAQLNSYIRVTMPFWKPGLLTEEEAWQVTAFLVRENNLLEASTELDSSNAADVKIPRATFLTPSAPQQASIPRASSALPWMLVVGALILLILLAVVLRYSRRTPSG